MPKKPHASTMTDKQLVRKLFPKHIRKALKDVLLELNADKGKKRKRKK